MKFDAGMRAEMPGGGRHDAPGAPGACSPARLGPLDMLTLAPGEIDIWVAMVGDAFDADLAARFDRVLSADERARHGKFLFEKDRRRYLMTRALVRYVLSRYAPIASAQWRFEATAFGRPFIVDPHPAVEDLTFNISHSDQVVLLALTRACRLGVDVEDLHRAVPLDIADSFFSAGEVRQLRSLPPASQARRFLDFWTLKESYIKAHGKGLSLPLDQFGFELSDETTLHAYFDTSLNDTPRNWTFWQWRPTADSIAALCAENRPDVETRITVRRTLPFVRDEAMAFEVLRRSG